MKARSSRRSLMNIGGATDVSGDEELSSLLAFAMSAPDGPDKELADALTHGFHPYPARMHPAVARSVIASFSEPSSIVLDPFAGSGTVLVEGLISSRRAAGVDLNPLAVRLAEVKCDPRSAPERDRFLVAVAVVAASSEARVRSRTDVRAPLSREEAGWYDPHVLKELAGLREEIRRVPEASDRVALDVVFSSMLVKFSRQRADTSEERAPKRIRKGLVTEFFVRKSHELTKRWAALEASLSTDWFRPRVIEGDARELSSLLRKSFRANLILSSPPYGGTYDYFGHHERRFAWLDIDPSALAAREIGSRRRFASRTTRSPGARWDEEMSAALRSMRTVLDQKGKIVLLVGDAEIAGRRVPADEQLERIAPAEGLEVLARASQLRVDWRGGARRREHLIALGRKRR